MTTSTSSRHADHRRLQVRQVPAGAPAPSVPWPLHDYAGLRTTPRAPQRCRHSSCPLGAGCWSTPSTTPSPDLVDAAGISTAPGDCVRPRVHDFRHSSPSTSAGLVSRRRRRAGPAPLLSTWIGHIYPASTYWYLQAAPELLALAAARPFHAAGVSAMTALAPILEAFFTDHLMTQRQASPHTVAAYRDTFRLLLRFAQQHRQTPARWTSPTWTSRSSAVPATPGNRTWQQRRPPATPASPPSTPCSPTPRCACPNTPADHRVLAMPPKRYDRPVSAS